jgi:hypothetical protein
VALRQGRTIFTGGHVDWHESQIRILLSGPTGEVSQEIQRRARAVQRRAQSAAPSRTGALRASIHINTRYPSEGAVAEIIADAPHALYVEFGRRAIDMTGTGKFLHWLGPNGSVFAQVVAAVPATHFMRDALDAAE